MSMFHGWTKEYQTGRSAAKGAPFDEDLGRREAAADAAAEPPGEFDVVVDRVARTRSVVRLAAASRAEAAERAARLQMFGGDAELVECVYTVVDVLPAREGGCDGDAEEAGAAGR
jgi:hypothetical protein